jgi:predicted phage baseplate assembly protein
VPVFNELLGFGDGEPDQTFGLGHTPVIVESIRLVVEGSRGPELWRLTDDLLATTADPVFSLDAEAGVVRFGDGLRGLRPPAGARILASYEYGGGLAGNVAIGAIKSSPDVRLQGGFVITNPVATWGGDIGQSVAEAERSIPLVLRHRDRAVTEQDFKDVTRRTPGVDIGRVEVLPLFNPDQPGASAAGTVTVLAIPRFDPLRPRWPTPDRLFLQSVCDYLEPRRLVTTEVYVRGPVYRLIYVTVGLQVRAGYFRDVVRRDASARLYEYLSALPPGGPDAEGWPLNKRLLKKDLEAVVTRVAGVEYVDSLFLGVGSPDDRDDYAFSNLELPLLSGLSVVEGQAEPLTAVVAGGSAASTPPIKVVPVPVIRSKC